MHCSILEMTYHLDKKFHCYQSFSARIKKHSRHFDMHSSHPDMHSSHPEMHSSHPDRQSSHSKEYSGLPDKDSSLPDTGYCHSVLNPAGMARFPALILYN